MIKLKQLLTERNVKREVEKKYLYPEIYEYWKDYVKLVEKEIGKDYWSKYYYTPKDIWEDFKSYMKKLGKYYYITDMGPNKIKESLLKEADSRAVQNVKDKKVIYYMYVQGGRPQQTEVLTFFNMAKGNYKWKSDKQANYFYSVYARAAESIGPKFIKDIPKGTEMIFRAEMEITGAGNISFGRKSRVKELILYLNRNGLIRADKVIFKYDDKEGSREIAGLEKGNPTGIKSYEETPEEKEREKVAKSHRDVWNNIKKSKHVGRPGEKMEKTLYFLNYTSIDTRFGRMDIFTFYDEDFNVYVYKGSSLYGVNVNNRYEPYKLAFTIKGHDSYKGTDQTLISRVKVK